MKRYLTRAPQFFALFVALAVWPASCAPHNKPATQPPATAGGAAAPATPAPSATAAKPAPAPAKPTLPERLSDEDFWKLSSDLSEPDGYFRSDNLLSNEIYLQYVIPDLLNVAKTGRVYMGVGPEQNFTYITALKPTMAVIVDIRRGNLDLHLMYKALFEMSDDRADFVSRLFARKRPDGLAPDASVKDLFTAYLSAPYDEEYGKQTYDQIIDLLKTKHHFALSQGDTEGILFVYQFFEQYGPELTYWMSGGFGGGRGGFRNSPTYAELMTLTDQGGALHSYLATNENYNFMKQLEARNMLLPVVGNFAGPKALRSVGAWLKEHNAVVSAFYLSNVEQYLNMDGIWNDFCANAATLPIDDTSQFIRSYRGGGGGPGYGGGSLTQGIFPMNEDLKKCASSFAYETLVR